MQGKFRFREKNRNPILLRIFEINDGSGCVRFGIDSKAIPQDATLEAMVLTHHGTHYGKEVITVEDGLRIHG